MTTREEAIRLAQEAGLCQLHGTTFPGNAMTPEILMEFAQLVENNALEKAARLVRASWDKYECEAAILALVKE